MEAVFEEGDGIKYSPPTTRDLQAKGRPHSSTTPTHLERGNGGRDLR